MNGPVWLFPGTSLASVAHFIMSDSEEEWNVFRKGLYTIRQYWVFVTVLFIRRKEAPL